MAVDIAEVPASKRPRDLSFYLVLFALILPLWSVTPLSWVFLIYALGSGKAWQYGWPGQVLVTVALSEAIFGIYQFHLTVQISRFNQPAQCDLPEIEAGFKRLLRTGLADLPEHGLDETISKLERDDPRAIDFRNSLRTWFHKATWSSIRLKEVQQWIFWSAYNADMPPLDQLSPDQRTVIKEALELIEMRTGCNIPHGSDPQNAPMRLTIDPIKVNWRPLLFYAIIGVINRYLRGWFVDRYSMQYGSHRGLEYLIRTPKAWNNTDESRPVLFIHGLGLGLLQYTVFLCQLLNATANRPVLVLLQPHISQDFFHRRYLKPHSRKQTVEELLSLLVELGWVEQKLIKTGSGKAAQTEEGVGDKSLPASKARGITVLSHSNGSYTHAWLLKDSPEIVARSCFADPVTFCSWEGDVCYHFNYSAPTNGAELLMRYFVATELGVANLIQRRFDWTSNSLWYEEIPNARDPSKTFFLLGGKDSIVNSERVIKYLHSRGVRKGICYDPNGRHGQALVIGGSGLSEILRWLEEEE